MITASLAALVLSVSSPSLPNMATSASQDQTSEAAQAEPHRLDDLPVEGRTRDLIIRDFVRNVADPVPGQSLSRWNDRICVGVVNMRREMSQYLIDRISHVANDLGVQTGGPGCRPNIHIVASTTPKETAQRFMAENRRNVMPNVTGAANRATYDNFLNSGAPIRWWYLNEVVERDTGRRAFRHPGDEPREKHSHSEQLPYVRTMGSRLYSPYADSLRQAYVIVDLSQLTHLNSLQLADYLAVVTLAQISPTADTSTYDTVLNVVADSHAAPALTQWDQAYLNGLYSSEQTYSNVGASRLHIQSQIARAADRLAARTSN